MSGVDASAVTGSNWRKWLDEQVDKFGEFHKLIPLNDDDWTKIDPIDEAGAMIGDDKVLPVCVGNDDSETE